MGEGMAALLLSLALLMCTEARSGDVGSGGTVDATEAAVAVANTVAQPGTAEYAAAFSEAQSRALRVGPFTVVASPSPLAGRQVVSGIFLDPAFRAEQALSIAERDSRVLGATDDLTNLYPD